ncbi:MAG: hypothetical protein R8K49_05305 [Mariprofundaceae bacterium]
MIKACRLHIKLVVLCAIGALPLLPQYVQAVEFGSLRVVSHSSEPLKAQINLSLDAYESKQDMRLTLASAKQYQSFGLDFNAYVPSIKLILSEQRGRQLKFNLTSNIPFKNGSLTILIKVELEAKKGYFKAFQFTPKTAVGFNLKSVSEYQGQAEHWAKSSRYGPVQAGESLGGIAMLLRLDKRFSNRLVMLSLYEKNKAKFRNEDIHQLKLGAYLQVPNAIQVEKFNRPAGMLHLNQLLQAGQYLKAGKASVEIKELEVSPSKQENTHKINEFFQESQSKAQVLESKFTILSKGAAKVKKSIVRIKDGMAGLKQDILELKQKPLLTQKKAASYWQWAFYILLISMILWVAVLCALVIRKGVFKKPLLAVKEATKEVALEQASATENKLREALFHTPLAALIAQAESHLDEADYVKAGQVLECALVEFPESFKAAALQATLYHETNQVELRNHLINKISESSDAEGWEFFCDLLDENVWDACFGENRVI